MIYESRVYEAVSGKFPALNDLFGKVILESFKKHGFKVVGFWTDDVGISNRLTHILAFEDMVHRDRIWAALRADEGVVKAVAEVERDGPQVARIHNTILKPTSYSPLQ